MLLRLCDWPESRISRGPSNKGMKLTKPGELRSFTAYPRCSTDHEVRVRGIAGVVLLAAASSAGPELGVRLHDIAPTLDLLMEPIALDARMPRVRGWSLFGQNDTAVWVTVNARGWVRMVSFQFYLGSDPDREAHFQQSLPIARYLIGTLMWHQRLTLGEIAAQLRAIEHTDNIKEFREPDRVMYFRYKKARSVPEAQDGYRCFRVEIGGPDTVVSEER